MTKYYRRVIPATGAHKTGVGISKIVDGNEYYSYINNQWFQLFISIDKFSAGLLIPDYIEITEEEAFAELL